MEFKLKILKKATIWKLLTRFASCLQSQKFLGRVDISLKYISTNFIEKTVKFNVKIKQLKIFLRRVPKYLKALFECIPVFDSIEVP